MKPFKIGDDVIIINGSYAITSIGSKGKITYLDGVFVTIDFYYLTGNIPTNGRKEYSINLPDIKKINIIEYPKWF